MALTLLILWSLALGGTNPTLIIYEKENAKPYIQERVRYVQESARRYGIDMAYMPLLLGQLDYENPEWNERTRSIAGDLGIPQFSSRWNKELINDPRFFDYKFQIDEYLNRIKERLNTGQTIKEVIKAHHCPSARDICRRRNKIYWQKVIENSKKFRPKIFFKKRSEVGFYIPKLIFMKEGIIFSNSENNS